MATTGMRYPDGRVVEISSDEEDSSDCPPPPVASAAPRSLAASLAAFKIPQKRRIRIPSQSFAQLNAPAELETSKRRRLAGHAHHEWSTDLQIVEPQEPPRAVYVPAPLPRISVSPPPSRPERRSALFGPNSPPFARTLPPEPPKPPPRPAPQARISPPRLHPIGFRLEQTGAYVTDAIIIEDDKEPEVPARVYPWDIPPETTREPPAKGAYERREPPAKEVCERRDPAAKGVYERRPPAHSESNSDEIQVGNRNSYVRPAASSAIDSQVKRAYEPHSSSSHSDASRADPSSAPRSTEVPRFPDAIPGLNLLSNRAGTARQLPPKPPAPSRPRPASPPLPTAMASPRDSREASP